MCWNKCQKLTSQTKSQILNYRLVEEPIDRFDPKICRQHLQECLKKVLKCYDVLDESVNADENDKVQEATIHRDFIESLYLLLNLGSSEALTRAIRVPQKFKYVQNSCC